MEATHQLLDIARDRMRGHDLLPFCAYDPGGPGYARALGAVVARGHIALSEPYERHPLFESFDFTEIVGLVRWGEPHDRDDRWFRVLTSAASLACRPLGEEEMPLHYTLVTLLKDVLALEADGDPLAPVALLPAVLREARESVLRGEGDYCAQEVDEAFCIIAELLVGEALEPAEAESLRVRLEELGAPWTLTFFDQLHDDWRRLIRERFPASMPETRALLLGADGPPTGG
ncbi:MAG: hypothetical protein KC656_24095 [Myxococcales bacterium]|nr:hypothetical protein [Myxococcales bacterium]MCA9570952.1 hypothetical protein [Myxococcales bacterium]